MRDTGFKVQPHQVDYHPEAANRELAIWEAKKAMGVLTIATEVNAAQKAMCLAARLRKNKGGGEGGSAAGVGGGGAFGGGAATLADRIKARQEAAAEGTGEADAA